MKKLINIGFLLTVTFCSLNVFGDDGGMTSGNKNCTQNCGGLFGGTTDPNFPEVKSDEDSTLLDVYTWVVRKMNDLID